MTINVTRTIILHYHLFKNAGTSIDSMLKKNFGDAWVTKEFSERNGNNTEAVEMWIRETPEAIAYSSHTMMGPLPNVEGVELISFIVLRDPIDRIKSAYRFERKQESDSWGAALAKEHDFEGYVRARLQKVGDRQCRNFQTFKLSSIVPGVEPEIIRAKRALGEITVVGRVEMFDDFTSNLKETLESKNIRFSMSSEKLNQSGEVNLTYGSAIEQLLVKENELDFQLIAEI